MHGPSARIAVISGGTGYVGSAIAARLAADGFAIAALHYGDAEGIAADLIARLPGAGHRAYACDITDAGAVRTAIAAIEKDQGPVRAVVHAAATPPERKQLHLSSAEDMERQMRVNVSGGLNLFAACAPAMKERGAGVMVGITTAGVATGMNTKARGAYSPMKFALQGILVALKEELAPFGIRIYSVAPGVLPGGMNRGTPQAFLDMVRLRGPSKTLASAEDVAEKIAFLCSDEGRVATDLTVLIAPETATS